MSTKEALHQLVEELADDQVELARVWLENLRSAGDPGEEPFSDETLASLDRGLKDAAEGRLNSLEWYEIKRGL